MPAPKFNFVPERQLGKIVEDHGFRVSVTKKGLLMFGSSVVYLYELDKKYIRLFGDIEKKTIGWSIIENDTTLNDINDARLLKKNIKSGIVIVSIKKLLKSLGIKKEESYKNLEVKRYLSPLHEKEIYYIQLT